MKRLDTIYHVAQETLKKPQVRRRIKWGAVILLLINLIAWPLASFYITKPKETGAWATLQYVGGNTGSGTGSTYSISLTALTGGISSLAAAGDLVIVTTGWASASDDDPGVNTTGYTEISDFRSNDTRDANISVNWKRMETTPDTSVTVRGYNNAANGGATVVHVWRNADELTPMDVTRVEASGGNAANANSPSITPSTSGAVILAVGIGTGDATPLAKTGPSGMSNWRTVNGTGSTMSAIAGTASYAWTSGAYDPAAWTGGESTTSDSWAAVSLAIRPDNDAPTLTIDLPASDTDLADGANYQLQYDLSDGDSTADVDFYYETDGDGSGGTAISACQNQVEGTNATCSFNPLTESMSLSTYYYIYGVASDGGGNPTVTVVSTGRIRVNDAPTLSVTDPDGTGDTVNQGQTYTIYFTLADTDSTVTVDLYYDVDGSGLNGTAIAACQNLSEATASCGWDTTSVTPDTYYIYGRDVNDGVNAEVTDYSPGEVTVQSGNANPDTPTNLGPAGFIDASGWTGDNTPTFNFDITDPDTSEQVKYRIQIDDTSGFGSPLLDYQPSSYGAEGTYNYTVGQAGSYAIGSQGMTLSDTSGYYWRVKAIDDDSAESSYEEAGVDGTIDFRVDATGPTSLSVYDGTVVGVDQDNSGTALNSLAANWTAANFNVSGPATPNKYQYAIGTTVGGTEVLGWTSTNTEGSVVTASSLSINTSTMYYWTVRATDLAGNVTTVTSNGQMVLPTLSFSFDTPTVTFADLGNSNNWTDTKQTNITTQTNAVGGYTVQARIVQLLTSLIDGSDTIANWTGTYATPAAWSGNCIGSSQCGFGYTSSDSNITTGSRGNMYNSGANYCAYSGTAPGDVAADSSGPTIDGSRNLINEVFTLTHKVSVDQNQTAGKYQTTLQLLVTANY